jgi:hypothetical protein
MKKITLLSLLFPICFVAKAQTSEAESDTIIVGADTIVMSRTFATIVVTSDRRTGAVSVEELPVHIVPMNLDYRICRCMPAPESPKKEPQLSLLRGLTSTTVAGAAVITHFCTKPKNKKSSNSVNPTYSSPNSNHQSDLD